MLICYNFTIFTIKSYTQEVFFIKKEIKKAKPPRFPVASTRYKKISKSFITCPSIRQIIIVFLL
ncbi:MAG: hypothetical protein COW67_04210 [Flavobacteriales bacterium CG18_big_fil_WC_8_21_14_2_50_32_9]|nr:MAG: hypothetical protein COW67_04210 [Flavobacteriales bacterium CG18_big_fil_WC_8_21_14_2_50_32_9]PIZ06329.1 MAG: hypothetical protein COY57_02575 [Flavobacteriales bacterium CG_4_10_14_0_8_um_filter_32_5]